MKENFDSFSPDGPSNLLLPNPPPFPPHSTPQAEGDEAARESVVVVGHCCESGDLLSCAPGDPETLAERSLTRAEAGDLLVVEGAGAYCSAMSTKNYNSFPEAPELVLDEAGALHLVRRRQTPEEVYQTEVAAEL